MINYLPYTLAAFALLLSLWLLFKLVSQRGSLPRHFKNIDSDVLDNYPDVFTRFYSMAFNYRVKQGSEKYRRHIIDQFRFFYNFHNQALHWINEIVSRSTPHIPTFEFILSSIRSGHLGQMFTEINYAAGIADTGIPAGSPLIAYAKADAIELWSPLKNQPICTLENNQLDLQRATRENNFVTGTLFARNKLTKRPVQIRLQFPDHRYDTITQQLKQHDVYATKNYQKFKSWLKANTRQSVGNLPSFAINPDYGIEVNYGIPAHEDKEVGSERMVSLPFKLRALAGRYIDACFHSRVRLAADEAPVEFFIVMCSGLGLVVILENKITGKVIYNGDAGWIVYVNDRTQIIENPCLQARRIEKYLKRRLSANSLSDWSLLPLVVCTANNVELLQGKGKRPLQCDVLKLEDLEQWLAANMSSRGRRFARHDSELFSLLLNNKQRKYSKQVELSI